MRSVLAAAVVLGIAGCAGGGGDALMMTGAGGSAGLAMAGAGGSSDAGAEAGPMCVQEDQCAVYDFSQTTVTGFGALVDSATCPGRKCVSNKLVCNRAGDFHCMIPAAYNPYHVDVYCPAAGDNDCNEPVTGHACESGWRDNMCAVYSDASVD